MDKMLEQFKLEKFPDFTLDLTVIDFLISHGPKTFNSPEQFEQFDHIRYQMHHINNELAFLFVLPEPKETYLAKVVKHIQGEITALTDLLNKA